MEKISKSVEIEGKKLTLEIGHLAEQANMAVLARLGDTMVLATVVSSKREQEQDFFPLKVDYVERLYAGGRIKGSRWVKREGRPSDEAILKARLIDRSIRPLFPKDYKNEVQVIVTILSVDGENEPDVLSIIATSAALYLSDIPWHGPVGAVRIGFFPGEKNGHFLVNPLTSELEYSKIDLTISGTKEKLVMLEGGAKEVSEGKVLTAILVAQEKIRKIVSLIKDLKKEAGREKQRAIKEVLPEELKQKIKKEYGNEIKEAAFLKGEEKEGEGRLFLLKEEVVEKYQEKFEKKQIGKTFDEIFKSMVRERVLKERTRLDGRKPDEIREIEVEVGMLPRTHGSAIFKRGATQALTVVTLASPSLEQWLESPMGEETKRYIHHYYMPPFSVGETGRLGWPSRREIGHGALAERALLPVIPSEEKFPYTIRVVSEITSSNGSTSMAAVCGSTLSLMDAGVPIKEPVAGIAMGLMTGSKGEHMILTDILGIEDFCGDMDFKVAGTKDGITALQLDTKTEGLGSEILKEALEQAKVARHFILEKMLEVLPAPRSQVSKFAPKIKVLHIPVSKIGVLIGPGGKTIRQIIAKTNASVDVEEDGTVNISAPNEESLNHAISLIEGLTKEVKVGEVYTGEVKRILPFGAFVEIFPGREGLVHISKMTRRYIKTPQEVVKVGQKVKVKVVEVDEQGRINLTMLLGGPQRVFSRSPFKRRF